MPDERGVPAGWSQAGRWEPERHSRAGTHQPTRRAAGWSGHGIAPEQATNAIRRRSRRDTDDTSRQPTSMVSGFVHDLRDELEASQEHVSEILPVVEAQLDVLRARNIRASLLQEFPK